MSTAPHAMIYLSPFCFQPSIVLEMNVPMKVDKMFMNRINFILLTFLASLKTATGLIASVIRELKNTFLLLRANVSLGFNFFH